MIELPKEQIELYQQTDGGKAYLEYNKKIGGEPFGYSLSCPDVDELYGGIPGLYAECIKQGKTWEELLGQSGWDELEIES